MRLRFLAVRVHFPEEFALRWTQLDYDREMAFVALTPEGELAGVMLAAGLGNVTSANAVGNGVADDKLVYTYLPDLIRYHLGEEPIIPNVDTWRLEDPGALEEVLDRVMAQRRTRVSIQPKQTIVDEAVALVTRMKAEAWVGFNDGDLNKMKRVKALEPSLPVFWDWSGGFDLARDLLIARQCGFESIVVHHEALTEDVVKAITDAGFEPGAWTVNDAARMRRLRATGVYRLYPDYPRCGLEQNVSGAGEH